MIFPHRKIYRSIVKILIGLMVTIVKLFTPLKRTGNINSQNFSFFPFFLFTSLPLHFQILENFHARTSCSLIKIFFFFFLSKYNLHNFTSNICHDDNKKLLFHSVPFSELKWIDNIDRFFSIYIKKRTSLSIFETFSKRA